MSDAEDPTLWYFGYGSNMDPRTFLGRRRMRPRETCTGRLEDFGLVFDLPVGNGERGVANLRPCAGAHVFGVVYGIGAVQAAHLDRTEGVHRGIYQRLAVEVVLPDGATRAAYTLCSELRRFGRKPSRRYLGLLLAGARHHGLPASYVQWLRGLEIAVDEREARQGQLL